MATLEFKDRLAVLMDGMKPVELAAKISEFQNCSEANVSRWLSGDRIPNARSMSAIARALDCTPNDLLGFAEVAKTEAV